MKAFKLFTSMAAAVALAITSAAFTSCDDDDNDIPDVDVTIHLQGARVINGVIYVVEGQEFEIAGITVTNNQNDKAALITSASYYWDFSYIGTNPIAPFGLKIITGEYTGLGAHVLDINCPVYAVDKAPAIAYLQYKVVVVANESDLPDGDQSTVINDRASVKKGDSSPKTPSYD